jgi:CubicO group peptidase (beta-lactamase class C family)
VNAAGREAAVASARQLLERAIAGRLFPAASLIVGSSAGALWTDALGTLTFDRGSPPASADTVFDLASITKVVATTTVLMDLARVGRLRLDEPVSRFFEEWRGTDREPVTVRDLLEHASGLAARLIDAGPTSRREFEHDICRMPLEYAPRTQAVYSDLDFILLGFIAADRGGAPLAALFDRITHADVVSGFSRTVDIAGLTFDLPHDLKRLAAPTLPLVEDPRRGRTLAGEVHDNYAAALGGAAGHAGLFGTAPAVGAFARAVLRAAQGERDSPPPLTPELVAQFTTKTAVPASSRALGWDTMLPSSSCGTRMSSRAFGHVGFTGTSLWIDPERDRYFVLLTNRAHGGGTLEDMRTVRRAFHDALGAF